MDTMQDGPALLELDVEGQAFSIRFPTVRDSDSFKKGVMTGALATALVVGGAAGTAAVAGQINSAPALTPAAGTQSLDEARNWSKSDTQSLDTARQWYRTGSVSMDGAAQRAATRVEAARMRAQQAARQATQVSGLEAKRVHALAVLAARQPQQDVRPWQEPPHVEGAGR